MEHLQGALRNYPWGSHTLLAQLRGTQVPSEAPEAELWFGAHSAAPSQVAGRGLDAVIAADPEGTLGKRVAARYGSHLPFLLKLLAADEPLSIQAHPSRSQAKAGFAREEEEGIRLDDPTRNYKDPNPKPELIVALTPFEALAGFRPLAQTREFFAALNCEELDHYASLLDATSEEAGLRAVFTTFISLPEDVRKTLIDAIVPAAERVADDAGAGAARPLAAMFLRVHDKYPNDVGVLAALLLNYVQMRPGEALFLQAGQLHAYLSGLGVEIMANSDNVLRGGLTSKHVDVPELVKVLDFSTLEDPFANTTERDNEVSFHLPVDDFIMSAHRIDAEHPLLVDTDGPAIVLCTEGTVRAGDFVLKPGQAAWIPAADPAVTFEVAEGTSAQCFYARV